MSPQEFSDFIDNNVNLLASSTEEITLSFVDDHFFYLATGTEQDHGGGMFYIPDNRDVLLERIDIMSVVVQKFNTATFIEKLNITPVYLTDTYINISHVWLDRVGQYVYNGERIVGFTDSNFLYLTDDFPDTDESTYSRNTEYFYIPLLDVEKGLTSSRVVNKYLKRRYKFYIDLISCSIQRLNKQVV